MAGLDKDSPVPLEIKLHQKSRVLEIIFSTGERFELPYEFLRVYTPSAEARGHGPGQEVLQTGKREVSIDNIEAMGNYAIRPTFSDGHDTGLYSWDMLYRLGKHRDELWQNYLEAIEAAGASRDPAPVDPTAKAGGCGSGGCGSGACSK